MNDKSLFASEIVRKEIEHMHQLYKEIYMETPLIEMKSKEDKEVLLGKMERYILVLIF